MTRFRIRLLAALVAAALVFGFGSTLASADPGDPGTSISWVDPGDPGTWISWLDPGDPGTSQ